MTRKRIETATETRADQAHCDELAQFISFYQQRNSDRARKLIGDFMALMNAWNDADPIARKAFFFEAFPQVANVFIGDVEVRHDA